MAQYKKLLKENKEDDYFETELPYYRKTENEYRDIILDTIKKIEEVCTKQFRSAGVIWTKENGQLVKIELEDTRKIYSQLIDFFEDMMLRHFDEEITDNFETITKDLQSKYDSLLKQYILSEPKIALRLFAEKTKSFPLESSLSKKYEDKFEDIKHDAKRKRLRELLLLFARKRDLSGKRIASVY